MLIVHEIVTLVNNSWDSHCGKKGSSSKEDEKFFHVSFVAHVYVSPHKRSGLEMKSKTDTQPHVTVFRSCNALERAAINVFSSLLKYKNKIFYSVCAEIPS